MSEQIEVNQIWIPPNAISTVEHGVVFERGCYAVMAADKILEVRDVTREQAEELMKRFDEDE